MKPSDTKFVGLLSLLAGAAALALVASQVFTQLGLRRAMDAADHREAEQFFEALRGLGPRPLSDEALALFLAEHHEEGLRYVRLGRPWDGDFSAGEAQLSSEGRHGLQRGGGLVRAYRTPPHPPGDRPGPRPGKRPGKRPPRRAEHTEVIEFVPTLGPELQRDARLGLGASGFAVVLFVLLALTMRQMLRQRAEALHAAEDARRLAVLGEMTAVLAHEIRNPLASLKGHAQLLVEMLDGAQRRKADKVVAEAWRLEELTRHLLDFVRSPELKRERTDLAQLAREVGESIEGEFQTRGEASACVDAARVRQALTNIASNAAAAGGPVELVVQSEGALASIQVLDQGPGLDGTLEELCEPFYTTRTRGTGLGLSIAKRIIDQHGGELRAQSRPEGGACFTIELPREATS
ncbi:MAG: PAS domain-containing sensor histidine kinase [Polyangiales bacterium]